MKHEIIYTKHYALIISDENIKDVCKNFLEDDLKTNTLPIYSNTLGESKKIIAYRPLIDAPIFEGVPLLPEFEEDDFLNTEIQVVGDNKTMSVSTFLKKYGKETYKYTEDDLISFHKWAFQKVRIEESDKNTKELLDEWQSIKQPKRPKYFECEIEYIHDETVPYPKTLGTKPKTTTNSQGQTELIGEYIF